MVARITRSIIYMKMNGKDVTLVTDYMFVGFLTYLFRNCSSKFD